MNAQRALHVPIHGLGCGGGGATTIERELGRAPGVLRVYVNPATEVAYIDYDPAQTDARRLARVIDQIGYRAGPAVEF